MILAIDIGTSVCKGALFLTDGTLVKRHEVPLSIISTPDPLRHEADPREWISAVRTIIASFGPEAFSVEGIAVSGNGPTLLPVDDSGEPLHNALTWMDRRSIEEATRIGSFMGAFVDPSFYLPKALWFFNNRREMYDSTRSFISCPEFLILAMTGESAMVFPSTGYEAVIWSPEGIRAMGLDPDKFPKSVRPGDMVGRIGEKAASLFGLKEGVPVFAGGPDFVMSLLGTGTVHPGRACDRSGTSEGINLCSPVRVSDRRLLCQGHVISGRFHISGIISTSGKSLAWLKAVSGRENLPYDAITEEAGKSQPGAGGLLFLPYLSGERAPIWDPRARGAFIGLTLSHGFGDMARAVMEAVGFAILDVIRTMEENGLAIDELRITGSQAKSPLWNQIKADITGRRILVPALKDSELAGDLAVALKGMGIHRTLEDASDAVAVIEKIYEPDRGNGKRYERLFELYRESYFRLKDVFHGLGEI